MFPVIERELGKHLGALDSLALGIELDAELGGDLALRADQDQLRADMIEEVRGQWHAAMLPEPRVQLCRIAGSLRRGEPDTRRRAGRWIADRGNVARLAVDANLRQHQARPHGYLEPVC